MIAFCFVGALCGLVLGSRFRVMALVPFLAMVLVVMAVPVVLGQVSLGWAALLYLGLSVALQAAYLVTVIAGSRSGWAMPVNPSEA